MNKQGPAQSAEGYLRPGDVEAGGWGLKVLFAKWMIEGQPGLYEKGVGKEW